MSLLITIHVTKHGQLLDRLEFDVERRRVVKIGNSHGADVRLDEPAASRIHAVIEVNAGIVLARDLGTAIGTIINGNRVERAQLGAYNEILVGSTALQVAVQSEAQRQVAGLQSLAERIRSLPLHELNQLAGMIDAARHRQAPLGAAHPGGGGHHAEPPPQPCSAKAQELEAPERSAWRSPLGASDEKYDTKSLQAQLRREKRRGNAIVLLTMLALATLLFLPLLAGGRPKTRAEALLAAAAEERQSAEAPAPTP